MTTHTHHHDHHHSHDTTGFRLLLTFVLNLIIPTVQVIGGVYANSMALISDAAHNFSDSLALFIAYVADKVGKKEASVRFTFGYRRVEVLAAALNVALLIIAAAYIVYESAGRLMHPESVSGDLVMIVAGIGVAGNGFSAWLLHRDSKDNLNVKGAFLHMLGDLLTSVVVVINGFILLFKPWYWIDPLLSVVIALFIVRNCWLLMHEAVRILLNGTPAHLDLLEVKESLEKLPEVENIHFLHAWSVSSSSIVFSCHVVVPDQLVSNTEAISARIKKVLLEDFEIDHPVLQFETSQCGEGDLVCGRNKCTVT